MSDLACPICGTHLDIGHLLVAAEDRAAFMRMLEVADPLKGYLARYVYLFAPPKTALTQRKQLRIILSLLPDLERRAIRHAGRDWVVPLKLWEQGIDQMLALRDADKLALPMTGHKYLYTILAALADRTEAKEEAQAEAAKRAPVASAATYSVRGETLSMGAALNQVYGARDPVLARLDAEATLAAPMPPALRARLAQLKNPATQPKQDTPDTPS